VASDTRAFAIYHCIGVFDQAPLGRDVDVNGTDVADPPGKLRPDQAGIGRRRCIGATDGERVAELVSLDHVGHDTALRPDPDDTANGEDTTQSEARAVRRQA
jgi:hypothetical protein